MTVNDRGVKKSRWRACRKHSPMEEKIFLQLIVVSKYKHAQIESSITCVLLEQCSQKAHIIYTTEIIALDKKGLILFFMRYGGKELVPLLRTRQTPRCFQSLAADLKYRWKLTCSQHCFMVWIMLVIIFLANSYFFKNRKFVNDAIIFKMETSTKHCQSLTIENGWHCVYLKSINHQCIWWSELLLTKSYNEIC